MSKGAQERRQYAIGWDVGGWNCDKNRASRDAIVVLDEEQQICGTPWRGNLRGLINDAQTTVEWLTGLLALCEIDADSADIKATMAIDTPLGFSCEFRTLLLDRRGVDTPLGSSADNPYLFRQSERYLFERGLRPLSPVKDMIGSQATKGMHVLAKFAPRIEACGIWTDGRHLRAFESYPSACNRSRTVRAMRAIYGTLDNQDKNDALVCALVAHLYTTRPGTLRAPPSNVPVDEGWIWVPDDALNDY